MRVWSLFWSVMRPAVGCVLGCACLMDFAVAAKLQAVSAIEIRASQNEYEEVQYSISSKVTGNNALFPVMIQQSMKVPQKYLHYSIDMTALKAALFDESSQVERRAAEPGSRTITFKVWRAKDIIQKDQTRTDEFLLQKVEIWADPDLRNEIYVYALPTPEVKHWYSGFMSSSESRPIAFVFDGVEVKQP